MDLCARRVCAHRYICAHRYDRAIIDASASARELLPPDARACPLAVAHTINHPPRGKLPNVLPAPVAWDRSVPASLLELLPNVSFDGSRQKQRALLLGKGGAAQADAPPKRWDISDVFRASIAEGVRPAYDEEAGPTLKGLALIATRPLKDEELFLNYRLNPANKLPAWYAAVDAEEDARRWK